MKDQLWALILELSRSVLEKRTADIQRATCCFAVDRASLVSLHIYAFVLVYKDSLKLPGFREVENQSSDEIARAILKILKICNQHFITISCMVSDTAASLKEVIINNDHKEGFTLKTFNE